MTVLKVLAFVLGLAFLLFGYFISRRNIISSTVLRQTLKMVGRMKNMQRE